MPAQRPGAHRAPVWTLESLYEHARMLVAELDRRVEQRFELMDRAIGLAYEEARRWRDAANEWRGAMTDRDRAMMPRPELENRLHGQDRRIEALEKASNQSLGRLVGLPLLISLAALVLAAILAFKG